MKISPVTLEAKHVRLEPLLREHDDALVAASSDGQLWNSSVTVVPSRETISTYLDAALNAQATGRELPFVILQKSSGLIVGTTRFYDIDPENRTLEIGYTWLAAKAQRTAVNTETKLLLLTHAFEYWRCIRVSLVTDVLNVQSQKAILRIGAKQEGIFRNHLIMPDGRYRDSVCFSIIEEEWPEVKARLEEMLKSG